MFNFKNKGIAALPTILLLGGLAIEIIIALTVTSTVFVESEFGSKLSNDALLAANGGIDDAIMRVVLDKNFTSNLYTVNLGNYSADITACKDAPCIDNGKHKITSTGNAQTRRRKLEAILDVDSITGEVRLQSLKEVQL